LPNVPSSKGYQGGFGSKLMLKDIGLALQASSTVDTNLPLGKLTQNLFTEMTKSKEFENLDFSAIIEYLKKL
jgi:3-hydroxyisobutyrate dehydrogenase